MLEQRLAAMNGLDAASLAKFYATNAVLVNYADFGNTLQGSAAIADYFRGVANDFGMRWRPGGDLTAFDKYVIEPVNVTGVGDSPGTGATVHILELDQNGQIANEWIVGWVKAG